MTREEAIQALKDLRDIRLQGVEWKESLDMAIEALSAEPSNCINCKHYTETEDADGVHGNCTHTEFKGGEDE